MASQLRGCRGTPRLPRGYLPTKPHIRDQLHLLRIWANAARHHDDERWRQDGPRSETEALRLVSDGKAAIEALER